MGAGMSEVPLITIVIPTLNQVEFIEQALDSVLSQSYPRLRLIVLDGGSRDGTKQVLARYEHHFYYWRSAADQGPWPSILEGASQSRHGWFNWLNSDDFLLPGSLSTLAELIRLAPKKRWITGARLDVDCEGRAMRTSCPWMTHPAGIVFHSPFLPQDATFFRVDLFRAAAAKVPVGLKCIFDTVLHQVAWQLESPLFANCVLSAMRWHGAQLTSSSDQRIAEYQRPDVLALKAPLSLPGRLLRRLSRTRLHPELSALLSILLARGFYGAKELDACVYWPWTLELKSCSIAEAYSMYRS